jgi:ribosomal-protein-alanine N-acetyltransferase
MKAPDVLETSRLRLRPPRVEDAPAIFEGWAQDAAVTRYLRWGPHRTVADTRRFLEEAQRAHAHGVEIVWLVEDRGDARLLGSIALRPDGHRVELGYALARHAWGRGLATEAAGALTDWALAQPEIYRVWAVCDVENVASARVLEKIGMQREGLLRRWSVHPTIGPEPRDAWCYARVR